MAGMFGGASEQELLGKLLGGGPELEDFVSSSPQDLPSFDHAKRLRRPKLSDLYMVLYELIDCVIIGMSKLAKIEWSTPYT